MIDSKPIKTTKLAQVKIIDVISFFISQSTITDILHRFPPMQYSKQNKSKYLICIPVYSCNRFHRHDSKKKTSFDYSRLAISRFFRCSRQVDYAISIHTHLVRNNDGRINNCIAG
jgi:hypothetical protein